jgi:hypothetical protein
MVDFILVVGCQRSGTTLMAQIIGAHPLAVMIDENDGLYNWTDALFSEAGLPYTWNPSVTQSSPLPTSGPWRKLVGIRRMLSPSRRIWRRSEITQADSKTLFRNCCLSAMTKYRTPQARFSENGLLCDSIKFAVLKAPNLTYFYDQIPHAFPDAKIVYMFRDIRDVVSSMMTLRVPILDNQLRRIFSSGDLASMFPAELSLLRRDDNIVKPHVKMALVAKIKMSLAPQFSDNGFDVINVRYEELVTQPGRAIPHILEKLDLPQAIECLHHNDVFQGVGPGGTRRGRLVDEKSKGKWKDNLTQQQSNDIWDIVGDFMETLGYTSS